LLLLVINNDSSKVRKHGETYFTIRMGNREATQYYTKSENTSAIQSKARYDSKYEHITSTGYQLMNYEPGSVFKLNGKEYVLSELWIFHTEKICGVWNTRQIIDFGKKLINL
jgi:hypothetical protein